jgi:hypothetical protein
LRVCYQNAVVLVAKSMFEACNFPSLQRISAA